MAGRSRKSAKDAGTRFERLVADYLAHGLQDGGIDRQVKAGIADKGDVRGLYLYGRKVVMECKDYGGTHHLPEWLREAERERANADAAYGVVCWKRRNVGAAGEQYVTMTLQTFGEMLAGAPELWGEEDG